MLFFRADGTYDFSIGAIVEQAYRIEGSEVVFPPATIDGPEQRIKVQFTGQNHLKLMGDPVEPLARKGTPQNPKVPILGEWEGTRDMGGHPVEVRYLFYPNGKFLLLIPFGKKTLKYTIEGRKMSVERLNEEPLFDNLQIRDGILSFPGPSGKGNDYSRY